MISMCVGAIQGPNCYLKVFFSKQTIQYQIEQQDMMGFQLFKEFTQKLRQIASMGPKMDNYEDSYNLRRYRISQITISEAEKMFENIEKKFYKYYKHGESGSWFQNELRLFVWALICYIELFQKQIRQFTSQDWVFFNKIFYVKQPVLFEYQAKIIFDYSLCLKRWSQEQDSMLAKIVSAVVKIKWNEIAKSLFIVSEKRFIRTSKQCRERWLNHLDPSKTKLEWSLAECKALVQSVIEKGKKWASLVEILNGKRSQHSIKNKYNSMLIKQAKLTPHKTERQNCQSILEQLSKEIPEPENAAQPKPVQLLLGGQLKQNFATFPQEHILEKSNASLGSTVVPNNNPEPEMSLNFDDLILGNYENISVSGVIESIENYPAHKNGNKMSTEPESRNKKRKGKGRKDSCVLKDVKDNYCPMADDADSDSNMVFLCDLKLMIRQSQLDR